uniref:hypothetical protein n=1 Tax=uncultured Draconibacterium sp. TaxID=1573823 RepID=UPI0032176CAF
MKNLLKGLLLLFIITQGCNKSEVDELTPSPEYPFVYSELNQDEMATEIQKFNAINSVESLTLNEFGILSGYVPVDLSNGIDASTVKNNISFVVNTYARFLGISNPENISIESDFSIRTTGGVNVTLSDFFQNGESAYPVFSLHQSILEERDIEQTQISFYFSEENNQMEISGRWFPETFIPSAEIKNQEDALNIAVQNINENHNEITPLNLSNVKKVNFRKVIYPLQSELGIEMRECWEVIIWDNTVKTLVDTQTGEIVYFLEYGNMI